MGDLAQGAFLSDPPETFGLGPDSLAHVSTPMYGKAVPERIELPEAAQ
jgi:hypothetical protein